MGVQSYTDLIAWQKSMFLVEQIYQITKSFPNDERFGLISQLRRAAVSVPSNIAEGQGGGPTKEFTHHLAISYGSLCEVQTQLLIAQNLGYIDPPQINSILSLSHEVGRLINGLSKSINNNR